MDRSAMARRAGIVPSTERAMPATVSWVVKSATRLSAKSARVSTWWAQSAASVSSPGRSASGIRSVMWMGTPAINRSIQATIGEDYYLATITRPIPLFFR